MVALAGAHTIGGKGFGEPYSFDNEYYKTLLKQPWADTTKTKEELDMASHIGLTSDKNLALDEPSLDYIKSYAADQGQVLRGLLQGVREDDHDGGEVCVVNL